MTKRNIFILSIIVINIIIDQLSKVWARLEIEPYENIPIIDSYFILTNVENAGAFLGIGSDLSPTLRWILLLILPVIVLGFVTYHVFKTKSLDRLTLIGFSFILGGGISNVFDRFVYGSVTDFLHIDLGGVFRTGIFNLADVSVMVGMGLLLISSFKNMRRSKLTD